MAAESIQTPERAASRWRVVAAGFLSMTVAAGIGWFVFPVYLPVLSQEFGWSMADLGLAVTVWGLVGAAFSPVCGSWIDRYGARAVMAGGTLVQAASVLLLSRMEELWHLYAILAVFALGNVACTQVPVQTVISQWFDRSRGRAMGLALLGIGVGGFIMPNLAGLFLEHGGWRRGYVFFAIMMLAALLPILLWIRRGPGTEDVEPKGGPAQGAGAEDEAPDLTAREAVRTRSFWTVGLADAVIGLVFAVVTVHMVAFSTHAGIDVRTATFAFSIFVAVQSAGILAFAALSDAVPIRPNMVVCYGAPALAMLLLFRLEVPLALLAFAVVAGICGGGRTALYPLALGHCFGVRHLGSIFGWLNVPFLVGTALGPPAAGYAFDRLGHYTFVFAACAVLSIVSAACISLIRNERPLFQR